MGQRVYVDELGNGALDGIQRGLCRTESIGQWNRYVTDRPTKKHVPVLQQPYYYTVDKWSIVGYSRLRAIKPVIYSLWRITIIH